MADNLYPFYLDPKQQVILGTKTKIHSKSGTIFLGTNVSGKFHLGHLVLLSIAEFLRIKTHQSIVVSLNEVESVYARDNNLRDVIQNRKQIINFLTRQNIIIHSRIEDYDLLLLAIRLIKLLEQDKVKLARLQSFFPHRISASQIFELVLMAVAPIFVADEQNSKKILLLYGADQKNNLEYIFYLYQQKWFKQEVKQAFNLKLPELNYLIIKLIPNLLTKGKMSKRSKSQAVSLDQIKDDTKLTPEIVVYLNQIIALLGSDHEALKNPWLKYLSTLFF